MQFKFDKMFSGGRNRAKDISTVVGIDELASLFTGVKDWGAGEQLEQYGKSLYVFAAVNKIATKIASINLRMYRVVNVAGDADEIFNHEALDLLTRINPFQTRTEFLKTAWINKKLTGEAIWWKVRNNRGKVVELYNLRPDYVTVVSDPTRFIKHYELNRADGKKEVFQPEDIIHFRDPDPLNQFRGQSPLRATKSRVETEQSAADYQRNFFRNNARPDALLVSEESLGAEQRDQMTEAWEERHQDARGRAAGKLGILEGGMKYQQISISQREMDFIESMKFTRDDILVAFGVPKAVITTDDVNYANAEAGIRMFLSETITPEMGQLVETLNEMLISPDFGEQFFLDYDDPTPADRESQRKDLLAGHGRWMTINEIRTELNMPPLPDGDVIAATNNNAGSTSIENMDPEKQKARIALRRKALKVLQSRPLLRKRFELLDIMTKEIKKDFSENKVTLKKVKGASRAKAEVQNKEYVSLFADEDLRKKYYDFVNKKLDNRSKEFERVLVSESVGQRDRVIKALNDFDKETKGVYTKLNHADIARLLNKGEEARLFSIVSLPFLLEFAEEGGDESAEFTGETFDFTASLRAAIERRSNFFATAVTDTTFQQLASTLSEGVNAGEGIADLTTRVNEVYDDYPAWRARLIARTETTNANNEGSLEMYRQSAVIKGKEWINSGDSRVRDEHLSVAQGGVGGQIVSVDAAFNNGLQYPSEPNCRCVIAPALLQ